MYNFDGKKFKLLANTENGKTTSETVFYYKQEGAIVTADYNGGTIRYGKIIGVLENDLLNMLYQCVTSEGELKAGKALARVSSENGRLRLSLDWEWLNGDQSHGKSEYIEAD